MSLLPQLGSVRDRIEKIWAETELDDFGLHDGEYKVKVYAIRDEESKSGKKMVVWELLIEEGPLEGKIIKKFSMAETEDNIRYLKRDFLKAGLKHVYPLSEMDRNYNELLDKRLFITVKTVKDYQNIYIDRPNDLLLF